MCLLMAAKSKRPTLETLSKASIKNNDGAGIVWIDKESKKTKWKKGLPNKTPEDIKKIYDLIQNIELPFVIHLRNASYGIATDLLLTHPFIISNDSPLITEGETDQKLLLHNGTIFESDRKLMLDVTGLDTPPGPLSDSRILAMVLSLHKNLNFLKKIKGNFIVVDCNKERNYTIIGDTFKLEDGIYYSNFEWRYGNSVSNYVGNYAGCSTTRSEREMDSDYDGINYGQEDVSKNNAASHIKITHGQSDIEKYNKTLEKQISLNAAAPGTKNFSELDKLLELNIKCIECSKPLTRERITQLYRFSHTTIDTMKCIDCVRHNCYYPKKTETASLLAPA